MKNKEVLLLGGSGFIGSSIAKFLLKNREYNLTIVDNFTRGNKIESKFFEKYINNGRLKTINLDLTVSDSFKHVKNGFDYVFVLAALVGVDKVNKIPHEVIRVNTLITMNTLEWLKHSKCKRVLFSSTSENYAGTIEKFKYAVPTDENVPLTIEDISHPRFSYAITKILGESGFINYSKAGYFDAVIIRYHNVYGPNMGFRHVIPHLIERFSKNEQPFKIYGHDQTRSFNYVDDAVEGTVLALENGVSQAVYHIGSEQEITIKELTKYVGDIMGYQGDYVDAETFPGSVSRRCPDITKAKNDLKFMPRVGWKDGVKITVEWYLDYLKNSESKESFYDQFGVKE